MKTVLVILTQSNLNSLQVHESLSATMVLASFGCQIKVLFKDAGLSLLQSDMAFDQVKHPFKIASNLVDSFEFYDLSPILIESKNIQHPFVLNTQQEIDFIELNAEFIQSFDHVLYW